MPGKRDLKLLIVLLRQRRPSHFGKGGKSGVDVVFHLFHRRNPFAPHLAAHAHHFVMKLRFQPLEHGVKMIGLPQRNTPVAVIQVAVRVPGIHHIMSGLNRPLRQCRVSFPEMDHGLLRKGCGRTGLVFQESMKIISENLIPPHEPTTLLFNDL